MTGITFRDRTEEEDTENARGPAATSEAVAPPIVGPAGVLQMARQAPSAVADQITGYRYARFRDNTRAERLARETIYDRANDELFRITGQRLNNPERDDIFDPLSQTGTGVERYATVQNDPRLRWHAQLAEMAARDPRLSALYEQFATVDAVNTAAQSLREEVTRNYHDYLGDGGEVDQLARGVVLAPGMIAGGLSTGAPEQVAQLAAGGGGRGLNLIERGVRGALVNVLGQAAVEPAIIEDARRMGEEYSQSQVWIDFMIAAGFGATIDVAGGVVERANAPPIERMTDPPLREAALASRSADTPAEAPGEALQQALSGQAESLVVSAYSRDAATARTFPEPDTTDPIALADYINQADNYVRGEGDFPSQSRPVELADPEAIQAARRAADDTPSPPANTREMVRFNGVERPRTFMRFDPAELSAEPDVFQYKRAEGGDGLTGVLDGVEVFDPASAGKVKVFEYADGRRVIADGHQRRALARAAQRAGQPDVWLDGYLYREADGWTPREVRNLAAQKNLRETPGDPIDTAQLIREAPELIDSSVPQRSGGFRVAAGLAKLNDEAFRAVRAGVIEPRIGAAIGEIASDRPEIHEALVQLFQQQPPRTVREASFIVHEALQAEVFRSGSAQLSMFGDAPELSGMRERAEILSEANRSLRQSRAAYSMAVLHADELEAAGNVLRRDENGRAADLADAMLRHLDMLATRPSPVSRLLRQVADDAVRLKLSPKQAGFRFANEVAQLVREHGIVGLSQERPPAVDAPPPINAPVMPRLEEGARSAELRGAHDADADAFRQALAEVAVERAMRGDMMDMPDADAIGHTPQADMAHIEAALEALGIDDPTVPDVAAAIFARPTPDMEAEARARVLGESAGEQPRTFAEAVEQSANVEIWNPYDFDDEAKLTEAINNATLPQLEKIQKTFGVYGDGVGSRTRAEFLRDMLTDWRANSDHGEPARPVVPIERPAPSADELRDLIKRAVRFAGRDDAMQRYADARADLIDAVQRMGDKASKWLARQIEDSGDDRRTAVLREVQSATNGRFAIGDDAKARLSDADPEAISNAFGYFDPKWEAFTAAIDDLTRESNSLPVGVTEPIEAIKTIRSALSSVQTLSDDVIKNRAEWRAVFEAIMREDTQWFRDSWFGEHTRQGDEWITKSSDPANDAMHIDEALNNFDEMFAGDDVTDLLGDTPSRSWAMWFDDMANIIEMVAADDPEGPRVSPELAARASDLWGKLPDRRDIDRDAYEAIDEIAPQLAKLRRNIDELWDEWQGAVGVEVDTSNRAALTKADNALADVMAAFDGSAEASEEGLRTYSRPRGVRFAVGEEARAPLSTVADWTRAVQREFPRWGKKLLERGRLVILQSIDELPEGVRRGFYAKLFDAARTSEQRLRIADEFEHVRTSEIAGTFSDFYAWRSAGGAAMAVEIVSGDPRNAAVVSFGELMPGGIRIESMDEGIAQAVETIGNAMSALERDARDFRRPGYRFAGATDVHKRVYRRMFAEIDPPKGYRKIEIISDSGNHAGIAVVREDVAEQLNLRDGQAYKQSDLFNITAQRTRMPRSQALADKQNALHESMIDDLTALAEKARRPQRPGAFAIGRGIMGYAEDGMAYIVADNTPTSIARGMTLHEIGVHVGMREMLGTEGFEQFLSDVERLYYAEDDDIVAGHTTAVMKRTPPSQLWEETAAYAIMYADPNTMSDGLRGVFMRVLNSVRAWVWRNIPALRSLDSALTFEDMQFLALGALRHAARSSPRVFDERSFPMRLRDALSPKPRMLAEAVADAESGWLRTRLFHGDSGRPQNGMTFMSPKAKIAGLYGEIEAYEVRGPIFDASDDVIRTQDDFNRIVSEARKSGANGVYIRALDRGELGAQEQIVMFRGDAIRPAGSGRIDPNNPASVAAADASSMERVLSMLEHCR